MSFTTSPSRHGYDSFSSTTTLGAAPYQTESLKRMNDDMRARIAQYKDALASERQRANQAHRDKVLGIAQAQDEAQAMLSRRLGQERNQLLDEKTKAVANRTAQMMIQQDTEIRDRDRRLEMEEAEKVVLMARERRAAEERLRATVHAETAREFEDTIGRENYILREELTDMIQQRDKFERLYVSVSEADAMKANQIRTFEKNKEKEMGSLMRSGRQEFAKEMREMRAKDTKITALEKENALLRRRNGMAEADREKLSEELGRIKRAEKWDRSTPKKLAPALGLYDPALSGGSLTGTPRKRTMSGSATPGKSRAVGNNREKRGLQTRVQALQTQNDNLKREFNAFKKSVQPSIDQQDHLKKRVNELQASVRRAQSKSKMQQKAVKDVESRKYALEEELKRTQSQLALARKANRSSPAKSTKPKSSAEIRGLKARLEEQAARSLAYEARVVDLTKQLEATKKEKRALDTDKRNLQKKLVQSKKNDNAGQVKELTQQVSTLQQQLTKANSKTAPPPTESKEFKALKAKYDTAMKASKKSEGNASDVAKKSKVTETRLLAASKAAEAEKKRADSHAAEVAKLKRTVADFKEGQKKLEAAKTKLSSDLANAKKDVKARAVEAGDLKRQLEAKPREVVKEVGPGAEVAQAAARLEAANAKLAAEGEELKERRSELEAKLLETTQRAEDLAGQLDLAQAQSDGTRAEMERQADAFNAQIADLEASNEAKTAHEQQLLAQLSDLEDQMATQQSEELQRAAEEARAVREEMARKLAEAEALREKEAADRRAAEAALEAEAEARQAEALARQEEEQKARDAERERQAAEAQAERARQEAEDERLKQEQLAQEAMEEAERRAEAARLQQQAEEEAAAAAAAAAAAKKKEEEEAAAAAAEAAAAEEAAAAKAEAEAEAEAQRKAKEEEEAAAAEAEAERQAAEEAERQAAEEAERKAAEEKAEAERQAAEEQAARQATADKAAEAEAAAAAEEQRAAEKKAEDDRAAEAEALAREERVAEQQRLQAEQQRLEREEEERLKERLPVYESLADELAHAMDDSAPPPAAAEPEELGFREEDAVRLFRVLYDYDPEEASPNDDEDEELPLVQDEVIKIIGEMDEDGFYEGENMAGRRGVVPSNFVEELTPEEAREHAPPDGQEAQAPRAAAAAAAAPASAGDEGDLVVLESPLDLAVGRRYVDKVSVLWTVPRFCDDIDGYELFCDGSLVAKVVGAQAEMATVPALTVGQKVKVEVRSYNDRGEISDMCDPLMYTHGLEAVGTEEGEAQEPEDEADGMVAEVDESQVKYCVVLFDYDPDDMSPNENPEEELVLRQGQVLKVFGEVGEDGFYMAESNGRRGLLPSNFVEELDIQDPRLREAMASGGTSTARAGVDDYEDDFEEGSVGGEEDEEVPLPEGADSFPVGSYVYALYDYEPEELSPNDDAGEELAFDERDLLKILAEMDDDGFYLAEHRSTGKRGLVPCNFIEAMSDESNTDLNGA